MDANERRRRAAEEAAEWWVMLQGGEVSRLEHEQYVDWLRESPVHVAEMLRVAQVHGALSSFERWSELPTEGPSDPQGSVVPLPSAEAPRPSVPGPRHAPHKLRIAWGVAATVLVAAGIAAWFYLRAPGQEIETQRGERREVALADGSVVQVDPETRLSVDYRPDARSVVLERGRALFHVAKNPERPFWVRADHTTVRAVGTAFAVEQAPDAVVVTVAEGKVAVVSSPAQISQHPPADAAPAVEGRAPAETHATAPRQSSMAGGAGAEIVLTANEQVTVQGSGSAEPVRQVDSRRALAWADGRLIFENESVGDAIAEFNRYNRIRLNVKDPALAQRTVSGVFSASDPGSFVAFLETVAAVRVTRDEAQDITIEAK